MASHTIQLHRVLPRELVGGGRRGPPFGARGRRPRLFVAGRVENRCYCPE
jgi:hypothetical protein